MNHLEGIQQNNNILIVKDGLGKMSSKLSKQVNPNKVMIKQIEGDCERLDELYLFLNEVKEDNKTISTRNYYLESILITNTVYTRDLKNKVKDLEQQLREVKQNIKEI